MARTWRQSMIFVGKVALLILGFAVAFLGGYRVGYVNGYGEAEARANWPKDRERKFDPLWPADSRPK